jgi:cobalt/nickel transport protein
MTDQPAPAVPGAPTDPAAPPDVPAPSPPKSFVRRWLWLGVALVIVVAIVVILAPLASPDPDGLESIAEQQGWLGTARDALFNIFPDYSIPGLDGAASTIVSGLIGVGIVFLLMVGLGWMLRRRNAARG